MPYWIDYITLTQAGVKFIDGELHYIDFSPNYLRVFKANRINLGDIFKQLGTPDSYRAAYVEDISSFVIVYLIY